MKLIVYIALVTFAILLAAHLIEGVAVDDIYTGVIAALILGALNVFIRPILVILTLPITIITLGLFLFVINAGLLIFVASFMEGFEIIGFGPALLMALIVSLVTAIGNLFINE